MTYKTYHSSALGKFRGKFFRKEESGGPDSSRQRELLEKACDLEGEAFIEWLDRQLAAYVDEDELISGDEEPALPGLSRISLGELLDPPLNVMLLWFEAWQGFPPSDATMHGFWGYLSRQMIAAGRLKPYDLMASSNKDGKDEYAGRDKIRAALNARDEDGAKGVDTCVRNFLRHFSGFPEARGARTLYLDCPFSRAWWQCHIVQKVSGAELKPDETEISSEQKEIFAVLGKRPVWEQLAEKMASRLTVLGDENIRNGLVLFLKEQKDEKFYEKDTLKELLARIGVMTSWCALGAFSSDEVRERVHEISEPLRA